MRKGNVAETRAKSSGFVAFKLFSRRSLCFKWIFHLIGLNGVYFGLVFVDCGYEGDVGNRPFNPKSKVFRLVF